MVEKKKKLFFIFFLYIKFSKSKASTKSHIKLLIPIISTTNPYRVIFRRAGFKKPSITLQHQIPYKTINPDNINNQPV